MHTGNIYQQQERNDWLTVFLVSIFLLYYLIIGYATDIFFFKNDLFGLIYSDSEKPPYTTIAALLLAGAYVMYVFRRGDNLILHSVSRERVWHEDEIPHGNIIERIKLDDPFNETLVNVVHEMSIAAGMPMPAIYIIYDTDPNAFSTGRDPWHASIAVTSGLLHKLTREELQAAIAHEMAHIRNYDIRLMMLMTTLIGGVSILTASTGFLLMKTMGTFRKSFIIGRAAVFFPIWVGMAVLAFLVSWILTILVAQEREYQADATAAELTRNPKAMITALEKLEGSASPTRAINPSICHLCIMNPMGKYLQIEDQSVTQRALFDTHPPTEKRIAAMKAMAYIHQATKKIV